MLVKVRNRVINVDNVNLMTYAEGTDQGKLPLVTIIFQRNQYDDTNSILSLKGEEADEFWNQILALTE